MNPEKTIINPPPGQQKTTVEILEGKAPQRLDEKPPVRIEIEGTIFAPGSFLLARKDEIDPTKNHVIVRRSDGRITLVLNETDPYTKGFVGGEITMSKIMKDFGINQERQWEPNRLGQFFKMNRAYFTDKQSNMKLVSELKNFCAKINSVVEKQKSESGSFKDNYSGVVTSNLPDSFWLNIPIVEGGAPQTIEVEFYASVDGQSITLQLVSPGAKEWMDTELNGAIDRELDLIRGTIPALPIIEA